MFLSPKLPQGPFAIDPKAFGMLFCETPIRPNRVDGSIAIVSIYGALEHHESGFRDSYDAIVNRVADAVASSARDIVLDLTTPGGLVSGCREAAGNIRRMADRAGKRLIGFFNGTTCSAGYMLGCVCDQIWATPETIVGSIGVCEVIPDYTQADARAGVQYHLIASGKRKGDGMPGKPVDDETVAAANAIVSGQAALFFDWVSQHRPGLTPEAVASLEAATFLASEAAANGLIDRVGTFADLVAALAAEPGQLNKEQANMANKVSKILADLRSIAESEDEVEAAAAKKMLAGYGDEPKAEDAPPAEDAPKSEPPPAPAASAEASAEAQAQAGAFKALQAQMKANATELAALKAEREMDKLLATRPDFSAETIAELRSQPLAVVQYAVKSIPQTTPVGVVKPTRAPTEGGSGPTAIDPDLASQMDARMGIVPLVQKTERVGNVMYLGRVTPGKK